MDPVVAEHSGQRKLASRRAWAVKDGGLGAAGRARNGGREPEAEAEGARRGRAERRTARDKHGGSPSGLSGEADMEEWASGEAVRRSE